MNKNKTPKFIGMLHRSEKGSAVEAILKTGLDIYICDDAYNSNGKLINEHVTMYTNEQTITDFWNEYMAISRRKNIVRTNHG